MKPFNRTVAFSQFMAYLAPWLLGCALLLAQALSLMHGVVHAPQAGSNGTAVVTMRAAAAVTVSTQTDRSGGHWVDDLFSSHQGENDCRLYDQASHDGAVPRLAALALPVVLPPSAVAIYEGEAIARWAALFDARGPPLT